MIVKVEEAIKISNKLRNQKKSVVLVGGCFDILHVGHVKFLENAKRQGDLLFVLLENDENVKKLKGANRPINAQNERAEILSQLRMVDYVVLLSNMQSDRDYDKLMAQIKPEVIATTKNDPGIVHKIRQGKMVNAKVKQVIERLNNRSSTLVKNMLSK